MRALAVMSLACMVFLAAGMNTAYAGWTHVNDQIELDYDKSVIRVFVTLTGKEYKTYYASNDKVQTPSRAAARKLIYNYLENMTIGAAEKKVKAELAERPALKIKVNASITNKLVWLNEETTWVEESQTFCLYYTYDFKELQTLIPELNMPRE